MRKYAIVNFLILGNVLGKIPSSRILAPAGYADSVLGRTSSISTPLAVTGLAFVGAPSSADSGAGISTSGIGSVMASSPESTGSTSFSLTSQAVENQMNLQQCAEQVRLVNNEYTKFNTSMTGLSSEVNKAQLQLSGIDITAHNVLIEQTNLRNEVDRLNVLYNTLSVRANALGKWMGDEKVVRDNLEELYRNMYAKTEDQDARLSVIQRYVPSAVRKLADVQTKTAGILNDIAVAQSSMFDWGVNVTVAVNTHTTKLESVCALVSYHRISLS